MPMISIVDDDEAVREATKGLVRSLGYAYVWETWPTTTPTGGPGG